MANSTALFFDIFGRDKGVNRMLDSVGDKAKAADGKVRGMGAGLANMAGQAAGAALGAIGGLAIAFGQMAAEAEQNTGAVETVFGKAASKVEEFASRSASAVGLSKSQYNELSAVTGTALRAAGVSFDELAQKNDQLITRGADLASVFGGTTADAVRAMGSAFRGEFDPLERYGITLTMNAVNAELAARGQSKLGGAALETAKKQAILDLIMKSSTVSAGNFAREADTTAGAQARANAKFQDAATKLGEKLLPALTQLATVASDVADWVSQNSDLVAALAVGFGIFATVLGVAAGVMLVVASGLGGVAVAVAALVAALVVLFVNWDKIHAFLRQKWAEFTVWIVQGMQFIGEQWNSFWGGINTRARQNIEAVSSGVRDTWSGLSRWWTDGMGRIGSQWHGFWGGVNTRARQNIESATSFVRNTWSGFTGWWGDGMRRIGSQWAGFWRGIGTNARNIYNGVIRPVFDTVRDVVVNRIPNAFRNGVDWIGRRWSRLEGIVKAPISFLIHRVINGGLIAAFNTVADWIKIGKLAPVRIAGFKSGGYTGHGSPDEVAGAVHKGEYVIDAERTKALGLNKPGASLDGIGALAGSDNYIYGPLQEEIRRSRALKLTPLGGFPMSALMEAAYAWNAMQAGVGVGVGPWSGGLGSSTATVSWANLPGYAIGWYSGRNILIEPGNGMFRETVIHEVGHALGLGHSHGQFSIMDPMLRGGGATRPTPYDRANLAMLYGGGGTGPVEGFGTTINPIADIVNGVINGLKNAFSAGDIVAKLAVGVGKRLFDDVGAFITKAMGFGQVAPGGMAPKVFDGGGWFEKGLGYHGSTTPDAVLTKQQFADMHTLAMRGGNITVLVQNPWTGEYMEARVDRRVNSAIRRNATDLSYRRPGA